MKTLDRYVDVAELRTYAQRLLERGVPRDQVVEEVASLVDALVDWSRILGAIAGPPAAAVGAAVDALDRPALVALARTIVSAVERAGR